MPSEEYIRENYQKQVISFPAGKQPVQENYESNKHPQGREDTSSERYRLPTVDWTTRTVPRSFIMRMEGKSERWSHHVDVYGPRYARVHPARAADTFTAT